MITLNIPVPEEANGKTKYIVPELEYTWDMDKEKNVATAHVKETKKPKQSYWFEAALCCGLLYGLFMIIAQ